MIELDGVGFAYGAQAVLRDVDLAVVAGEVVCVVGANGAGKSTLLRVIAGLLRPTAGRARCFGGDPAAAPRHELARRLSFLPQEYRVAFPFTVAEVVLMGRYPHRSGPPFGLDSAEDWAHARAAMERCDVATLADRRFDELSGGERRRALLAQAFCQGSELVLLDEPTASLDPAHAIAVFGALEAETRARAAAAVIVTHDLNLAARFAPRVVLLDGGRIAADGAPRAVLASPAAAAAFEVALHVGSLPGTDTPFVVPG
jgi:iron complex transport system ATP-binding protein